MAIFNEKYFNPDVFAGYMETVPRVRQNALLQAGVLNPRSDILAALSDGVGGNYLSVPMVGLLEGDALNYDGQTNLTPKTIGTYLQNMVVVGRMQSWAETDFSYDLTKTDFMAKVAEQVAAYYEDVDNKTLLSILAGIFNMTGDASGFVENHTYTVPSDGKVDAATLNNAIQKAGGDNKGIFRAAIMHSVVATNLENLQLLEYVKQTDAAGLQRDTVLATWNGRTVLVDDDVPMTEQGSYVTYLLGAGAFDYADCGAKVPYETSRDAMTAGGQDRLITRQRKLFAPRGISFTNSTLISPTDAQLATGTNWKVVQDAKEPKVYINHKAIPFARIISKG